MSGMSGGEHVLAITFFPREIQAQVCSRVIIEFHMYDLVTFVRGRCGLKNGTTARPLRRGASRVITWGHPDTERGTKALGTPRPLRCVSIFYFTEAA